MGRTKRQRQRRKLKLSSNQNVINLLKWMKIEGNGWKSDLMLHNFRLDEEVAIRGLMSRTSIENGDEIIRIPLNLIVDRKKAIECVLNTTKCKVSATSTHLLLVMFILIELRKGLSSYWLPYLKTLPGSFEMPHFCTQEEFDLLPDYVKVPAELKRREIESRFQELSTILGNYFCSKTEFDWAWFAVNSRVIYFDPGDGFSGEDCLGLAPFLDMLNHSPKARIRTSIVDRDFQKISNGDGLTYSPYDQVFIHYGHHSNTFLFVEYGFVLPDNDDDFVPITLEELISKCAPPTDILVAVEASGLDEKLGFQVDGEPFGNILPILYIFVKFKSGDNIWHVFEHEDDFHKDPVVRGAMKLVINSKVRALQDLKRQSDKMIDKSDSFKIACNLLDLHLSILMKSCSKYCCS